MRRALGFATEAARRLQTDALHRKRALALGIVRHWAELVSISLLGSAWCAVTSLHAGSSCRHAKRYPPHRLSLVCFWTIRASVTMCDYVVSDKPRYNADVSIMEVRATHAPCTGRCCADAAPLQAVTELLQCRLTMKNFAWNQHWSMFLSYGLLREVRPGARALASPRQLSHGNCSAV